MNNIEQLATHLVLRVQNTTLAIPVWERANGTFVFRRTTGKPIIGMLSEDVQQQIMLFVGVRSIVALHQTCHAMRQLCRGATKDAAWRERNLRLQVDWRVKGTQGSRTVTSTTRELRGVYGVASFELPDGPMAAHGHAGISCPWHAALVPATSTAHGEGRQLLVAQSYQSQYGGNDNLRLLSLPRDARGVCVPTHSLRFDYNLARLPLSRCHKADSPVRVAVHGDQVFVLNRTGEHTSEVQVRDLASGALRLVIPTGQGDDMALLLDDDVDPASRGVAVLHRRLFVPPFRPGCGHLSVLSLEGAMRPAWTHSLWLLVPDQKPHADAPMGSEPSTPAEAPWCLASWKGLLYTPHGGKPLHDEGQPSTSGKESWSDRSVAVWSPQDGALVSLRQWPSFAGRVEALCVDDVASYVATNCCEVHAISHRGMLLASLRVGPRPGLRGVATLSAESGDLMLCLAPGAELSRRGRWSDSYEHDVQCIRWVAT